MQRRLQATSGNRARWASTTPALLHTSHANPLPANTPTPPRQPNTGDEMNRHQGELVLVHKQQQELERRLANAYAVGSVPRAVAAQLQLQLDKSSGELDQAEAHFKELERHYFCARACLGGQAAAQAAAPGSSSEHSCVSGCPHSTPPATHTTHIAGNELAESQLRAEDLEAQVVRLQQQLGEAAAAAQAASDAAAKEQAALQQQLAAQQAQLDSDRAVLEGLQAQAQAAKAELGAQQAAAAALQEQVAKLQGRATATETAKQAAEEHAAELAAQLADVEQEMRVLQNAHAETEHVAAQVAADLAAAREWASANSSRFVSLQQQLGVYQADLQDTHQKLAVAEAQHAAVGEELAVTKEQLAAEQAAHTDTVDQLAAARTALDVIKRQYLSTRDKLEAERARSMTLERTVADLKGRLVSLQQLREQQTEAQSAERAKWAAEVAAGLKQQDEARATFEMLQTEYFSACERGLGDVGAVPVLSACVLNPTSCPMLTPPAHPPHTHTHADERLDAEQQRVGTLESIVGALEERLSELAEAALSAPAASGLELGGGAAAELVVASTALRKEWKDATAALATTRHILDSLEAEYKAARELRGCVGSAGVC
jgi:DNA repair exonuclease SbcCD ATPase subunit